MFWNGFSASRGYFLSTCKHKWWKALLIWGFCLSPYSAAYIILITSNACVHLKVWEKWKHMTLTFHLSSRWERQDAFELWCFFFPNFSKVFAKRLIENEPIFLYFTFNIFLITIHKFRTHFICSELHRDHSFLRYKLYFVKCWGYLFDKFPSSYE